MVCSRLVALFARSIADPAGAAKLIGIGEGKPDASLPPVELAAMTEVAQAILNLDATIWKR